MKVVFRADATGKIGAGHLMRSFALAQALGENGFAVTFVTHCESAQMKNMLVAAGFEVATIPNPYPAEDDIIETIKALDHKGDQLCVIDGYHFDRDYQSRIREYCGRLMVIDDTAHNDFYDADVILNQNIDAEKISYECPSETNLLLGTDFVMLRQEFISLKRKRGAIPDRVGNILITFGSGDTQNQTLMAFHAIEKLEAEGLKIRAVVGSGNPHFDKLFNAAESSSVRIELIRNADNMAELMLWADLAISAAGSTCWEMAYLGLPAILIATAENQLGIANGLDREGFVRYLGRAEEVTEVELTAALVDLLETPELIADMGKHGRRLVDGKGCERIIGHLRSVDYLGA